MATNTPGQKTTNYGGTESTKHIQSTLKTLRTNASDAKQSILIQAQAAIAEAIVKDLYGDGSDKKTRYIIDLILRRIEALLNDENIINNEEEIEKIIFSAITKLEEEGVFQNNFSNTQIHKIANIIATKLESIQANNEKTVKLSVLKKMFNNSNNIAALNNKHKLNSTSNKKFIFSEKLIESTIKQQQTILNNISKNVKTIDNNTAGFTKPTGNTIFWKKFSRSLNTFWKISKLTTSFFIKFIMKPLTILLIEPIKLLFKGLWSLIKFPLKIIKNIASSILSGLLKGSFNILSGLLSTKSGIYALGYVAGYTYNKWLKPFFNTIKGPIETVISKVVDIFKPFIEWIQGKKSFADAFGDAMSKLWDSFSSFADWLWNGTEHSSFKKWEGIKGYFDKLVDKISTLFAKKFPTASTIIDWIFNNPSLFAATAGSLYLATKAGKFLIGHAITSKVVKTAVEKQFAKQTAQAGVKLTAEAALYSAEHTALKKQTQLFTGLLTKYPYLYSEKFFEKQVTKTVAKAVGISTEKNLSKQLISKIIERGIKDEYGKLFTATALKKISAEKGGQKALEQIIIKHLIKEAEKKVAEATGKVAAKSVSKKVPIAGAAIALPFATYSAFRGDWIGAAGEIGSGSASLLPGIGTLASIGIDTMMLKHHIKFEMQQSLLDAGLNKDEITDETVNKIFDQMFTLPVEETRLFEEQGFKKQLDELKKIEETMGDTNENAETIKTKIDKLTLSFTEFKNAYNSSTHNKVPTTLTGQTTNTLFNFNQWQLRPEVLGINN